MTEPPPEPESLDATRPHDLDLCSSCDGHGVQAVWRDGWELDATCPRCYGTGNHHD